MNSCDTHMTTVTWLIKRFSPILAITLAVAVGLAFFRAANVFLIGLQGMAAGELIGWLAGRLGRQDPAAYMDFRQRCWFGLSMAVVYLITHLVCLSALNAGPADTPLYWLEEVMQGFQQEEFSSAGRFEAVQGKMEGRWWVFMNVLDAGLFWFLFLGLCVAGLSPGRDDAVDAGQDELSPVVASSNAAFWGMCLVLVAFAAAGGLYWFLARGPQQVTYSAGIAAMKKYEGQWRFTEGQSLLGDDAESRSFVITALGPDLLLLKGTTDNFTLSLSRDGQLFTGPLFRLNQSEFVGQYSARVRFSAEQDSLTLAVVNFQISGRRDILLRAERVAQQP